MDARKNADMNCIRECNFRSYVVKNPSKIITAGGNVEVNLDGFTKRAELLSYSFNSGRMVNIW